MAVQVTIPTRQIADFCRRNAIRKLALFGSVLRNDFRPDSDIDVLVEFEPNAKVNYFTFIDMQDGLHQLFQREIDLHTPQSLSPYIRPDIIQSAEVIYEQER